MSILFEPDAVVDEAAHPLIGAAIEVHRYPGPGHLEAASELAREMDWRGIPYERQKTIDVMYKRERVGQ